jgi:general secretion pathway protein B
MSSILEALKKLEDEKAGRHSGTGNIAAKVAKPGRRPGQRPKWLLPTGMAVVAAAAALFTYILMGGFSTRINPVQPTLPMQPARQPQQPQQAAAPAFAPAPLPVSPPVIVRNRDLARSPSSPVARPAPAIVAPPPQPVEPPNVEKPAALSLPAAQPGPPALKVTGIGWQKGNADRLAIVNGRAVSEGAVVEGARVEEIFPDRVRFSINDKTFEISLGKISGE